MARHRLLRRDGVAVPHPWQRHQLRHRVDDRAAVARRDRRRRDAQERHRDRRLQPRGPHRPGDSAAGPPRREDQDRTSQRRVGGVDLRPLPHERPTNRSRHGRHHRWGRPRQGRPSHDRGHRPRDVPRRRGQPLPRGHLPKRRQRSHVLQGLLVRRHDRKHRSSSEEARHQAADRRRPQGHSHRRPPLLNPSGVQGTRGSAEHDESRRLGEDFGQEG